MVAAIHWNSEVKLLASLAQRDLLFFLISWGEEGSREGSSREQTVVSLRLTLGLGILATMRLNRWQ